MIMKKILLPITTAASILCIVGGVDFGASAQNGNPVPPVAVNVVADVFANYFAIQKSLAADSLANVASGGIAIASLVSADKSGAFRPELVAQAEVLAASPDLASARQTFKAVSGYLIQTWRAGKGPGGMIHEVHSPADNVDWLQQGEVIQNPYWGRACQQCGVFVK